ncbi:MAG TPA: pyrroline-5-carboxylate reductase [Terriglobia bacterium]|jgi:pyrroline-5-carboxylate reductase|nr:pyrroline-5-carboxylate reductase [Terriglobia bacterium]
MKQAAEEVAALSSTAKRSRDEIKKLALIGTGKLGEGLLSAMLQSQVVPTGRVECTVAHQPRADYLCAKYGVKAHTNNLQAVKGASLVLVALKPQQVKGFLHEVRRTLSRDALIVSAAASVTTELIERELGYQARVVRAMPNTPCLIRQGMTAIAGGRYATKHDLEIAQNIFSAMGRAVVVDEKHMDAITALSASGPAYVYVMIESLAEAGVKLGVPRDLSTELSAQTLLGASAMVLHTGEHPAKLKDVVTTPAGCTIDGLMELEEGRLRVTLIKAVVRAAARARQLVESTNS